MRVEKVHRLKLARRFKVVETPYGEVQIKLGYPPLFNDRQLFELIRDTGRDVLGADQARPLPDAPSPARPRPGASIACASARMLRPIFRSAGLSLMIFIG